MHDHRYFPYILETHLTDHCNLNCKGCSHFSPLIKGKVFTDINIFKRDFLRFKQIFSDIFEIRLMGGEPLLHPDLVAFCEFIRGLYPRTNISIFTNGRILLDMPKIFWDTCSKKDILIKLSYYPIHLDIDQIKQKAIMHHVRIKIPKQIKQFFKLLNIKGDSDPHQSFRNCQVMYKTPFLGNGKIFPCSLPPHIHLFNEYFNQNIHVAENNFINIFKDVNPINILKFVDHPIPMCKWCLRRKSFMKWDRSKRDINEWIGNDEESFTHFLRMTKYHSINLYHQAKKHLKNR